MTSRQEVLEMIYRQCPDHTMEVIEKTFKECNENVEKTIDALWNIPAKEEKPLTEWEERREICLAYEKEMQRFLTSRKRKSST